MQLRKQPLFIVIVMAVFLAATLPITKVVVAQDSVDTLTPQVPFSDQTISALQQKGLDTVASVLNFNAYNHSYKLFSIVGRIRPYPTPADGVVVLYQLDTATPKLVWQWDTGSALVTFVPPPQKLGAWPSPGDWLQNSKFLFGLYTSRDSTSWASSLLHIFELHSDQTVTSILKSNIPLGHIVTSVEIQGQAALLLSLEDIRGEFTMNISNCCGPRMKRFYEYDGVHMVDVSAKHIDEYDEQLGLLLRIVTTWKVENITGQEAYLFASDLLQMLMIYEIADQREEGWTLVQSLVAQAKASGRLADDTYVDIIFMPAMRQLFDENSPFIEPDYTENNAPTIPNYYAND